MATKATRSPLERALRESAQRARTTAGHERALGRSRSADAYDQVADWLGLLERATRDDLPLYWQAAWPLES